MRRDGYIGELLGLHHGLGTRAKAFDGGRQSVGQLLALLAVGVGNTGSRLLLRLRLACSGGPQLGHHALQLARRAAPSADSRRASPSAGARRASRAARSIDLVADLERAALRARQAATAALARRSCAARPGRRRAELRQLGRRGLLGLASSRWALSKCSASSRAWCSLAPRRRVRRSISARLSRSELRATVLGLDAQLLLGVLALLDTTQLVLTLRHGRLFGGEPLSEDRSLLGGLAHPLLKA